MKFPTTYIDHSREGLGEFALSMQNEAGAFSSLGRRQDLVTTGTTVVSLLSRDKGIALMASDGRVSGGNFILKEKFEKISVCRTGFVGMSGLLGLAQKIIPQFKIDLDNICDSRNELMTSTGAARRLFLYYVSAAGAMKEDELMVLAFLAAFWDKDSETCHLYELNGMAFLKRTDERRAAIGSGSMPTKSLLTALPLVDSASELLAQASTLIQAASAEDSATNRRMFYGLIENGRFTVGEEAL